MLKLCDVTKAFPNGNLALKGCQMEVAKGEFVFVVGPSGAGKSTLIKLLLREELPSQGQIWVNGVDITRLRRRDIPFHRRGVGVVFQDFRLLPEKTVYENVAFAMRVVEAPRRDILRQVPAVLHLVGLSHRSRHFPDQLSGGEQQRVSLARAVVNNPPLLLADEPTGNLDPDTSWDIIRMLWEVNRRGTTVLVATHAQEIVDAMKKRVIALENGEIVRDDQVGHYGDEQAREKDSLLERLLSARESGGKPVTPA